MSKERLEADRDTDSSHEEARGYEDLRDIAELDAPIYKDEPEADEELELVVLDGQDTDLKM